MVNFGDVGIICLNCDIKGACRNCLWWEWDSRKQTCKNSQSPICALYRERLFAAGSRAPFHSGTFTGSGTLT
jgi:hypothetical protein